MHFTTLRLKQFRNYPYLELEPSEGITVLYGPNGSGKTNLLEAMHLLSLGRSHRTTADREMVAQGEAAALVYGETRRLDGRHGKAPEAGAAVRQARPAHRRPDGPRHGGHVFAGRPAHRPGRPGGPAALCGYAAQPDPLRLRPGAENLPERTGKPQRAAAAG